MTADATTYLTPVIFEKLFCQYERKCIFYAYNIVRDMEVAKDMVHDCFTTIWEHRDQIVNQNIDGYIFTVLRNNCIMHRRLEQRGQAVFEKIKIKERGVMDYYTTAIESCNPEELFRSEMLEICSRRLSLLPDLSQKIFQASRVQGCTYKEIAERFDIPVKRVDREMQRIVILLRESLKDYVPALVAFIALFGF